MLTEDRRGTGIMGVLSVEDNISIASLDHYLDFGIMINSKKVDALVQENVKKMAIKTPVGKNANSVAIRRQSAKGAHWTVVGE